MRTHIRATLSFALPLAVAALAACGGGGGDAAVSTEAPVPPTYVVGGSLSGLEDGNSLALANNGADALDLRANGSFTFATETSGAYDVAVTRQPAWQQCAVSGGAGTATADVSGVAVACTRAATVGTIAGSVGTNASIDGTGSAAAFAIPAGLTRDAAGNLYVTEVMSGNVRKVTPAGVVTTVAVGIPGPVGIVAAPDGTLYIAASGTHEIYRLTPGGVLSSFAGSGARGGADGNGAAASFDTPYGLALDDAGNLYVTEFDGHRVRKVSPSADVTTFAGSGAAGADDGTGAAATFNRPVGIAVAADGGVYVADSFNHILRRITPAGVVTTFAGSGTLAEQDGTGRAASFAQPFGLALSADGVLFVADIVGNRVRRVSPNGVVTTLAGASNVALPGSDDGAADTARFNGPSGLALVPGSERIDLTDSGNSTIRRIGR